MPDLTGDRTQPSLPMKKGRAGDLDDLLQTERHDDAIRASQCARRQGTIGRCMQRQRHQSLSGSSTSSRRRSQSAKSAIWCSTTMPPTSILKVKAWLRRHPRFVFHFTRKSCSWLNAVEMLLLRLTRRHLRRGVFRPIVDLQAAHQPLSRRNRWQSQALRLDRSPDRVIAAVERAMQV